MGRRAYAAVTLGAARASAVSDRGPGSAGDRGVLELVELSPPEQVDGALDRGAGPLGIALGPVHEADEHRLAVLDERGDAPDGVVVHGVRVLVLHGEQRLARGDLGEDRIGIDTLGLEDLAQRGLVLQLAT